MSSTDAGSNSSVFRKLRMIENVPYRGHIARNVLHRIVNRHTRGNGSTLQKDTNRPSRISKKGQPRKTKKQGHSGMYTQPTTKTTQNPHTQQQQRRRQRHTYRTVNIQGNVCFCVILCVREGKVHIGTKAFTRPLFFPNHHLPFSGSSLARYKSWATNTLATSSSTPCPKSRIRSFKSRLMTSI